METISATIPLYTGARGGGEPRASHYLFRRIVEDAVSSYLLHEFEGYMKGVASRKISLQYVKRSNSYTITKNRGGNLNVLLFGPICATQL